MQGGGDELNRRAPPRWGPWESPYIGAGGQEEGMKPASSLAEYYPSISSASQMIIHLNLNSPVWPHKFVEDVLEVCRRGTAAVCIKRMQELAKSSDEPALAQC